jgi:3-hydroxy acid dehydrogenase/malonic semialdehyde reductase
VISLKDKIVFITGASSGIGEAAAIRFAQAEAKLILTARRLERLDKLVSKLGVPCLTRELDVRNRTDVERIIAELPTEWQSIDVLINNAGLARGLTKIHEGDHVAWEEMLDTNVKGLLWVSRAVIPGMVNRGRGHIINIGSIAGHELYPAGNVYCASKFAANAITKGMLIDLVDTPIRVTTIDPGLVQTEFAEVRFSGDQEKASKVYQGYQPLKGDDIADAIVWAATRPAHVQIAEMIILPTAQAAAMVVHKKV